jgi:hypothetical protein
MTTYFRKSEQKPDPCECKGFFTISQKSVHFSSEEIRDSLIALAMLCRESDITNFVNSLADVSILFKKFNPTLGDFFDKTCFLRPRPCENIR